MISYTVTQCEEVKIIHATSNLTGPVEVGETVQVTCNHGFQLYPDRLDTVTCADTGQFDRDLPECRGGSIDHLLHYPDF